MSRDCSVSEPVAGWCKILLSHRRTGGVMQMMDGSQNVVASYKYDAWGNDLTDPQSPIFNPFRYVGGLGYYSDKDSGLKLLGVRYYDSQIGRFWSLDHDS